MGVPDTPLLELHYCELRRVVDSNEKTSALNWSSLVRIVCYIRAVVKAYHHILTTTILKLAIYRLLALTYPI